jgi:hypothetical protein
MYHVTRLEVLNDSLYIEFWWKLESDKDCFHYDCDEYLKKTTGTYIHPILSSVTYFNDNDCPTIITPVDYDLYKYKDFGKLNNIIVSFPRVGKHITFDSKYYHGISNIFSDGDTSSKPRYMLAINLWDRRPQCVDWYSTNCKDNCDISVVI